MANARAKTRKPKVMTRSQARASENGTPPTEVAKATRSTSFVPTVTSTCARHVTSSSTKNPPLKSHRNNIKTVLHRQTLRKAPKTRNLPVLTRKINKKQLKTPLSLPIQDLVPTIEKRCVKSVAQKRTSLGARTVLRTSAKTAGTTSIKTELASITKRCQSSSHKFYRQAIKSPIPFSQPTQEESSTLQSPIPYSPMTSFRAS